MAKHINTATDRRAMVVGATGLVGGKLLARLVRHNAYAAVGTYGRRAPDLSHQHLTHHVADLSDRGGPTTAAFPGADVVFCCLGTTIKRAGSQQAFRAVDYEMVVAIAGLALDNGTDTFVVVSSVGADANSGNFYLRTKGEMEQAVGQLGFPRSGMIRPSLLLGTRDELRPAEKLGQYAARLINPLLQGGLSRYRAVDGETVAAAMIGLDQAVYTGQRIVEGRDIEALARSATLR